MAILNRLDCTCVFIIVLENEGYQRQIKETTKDVKNIDMLFPNQDYVIV